jgi:hypothetical protein
MRQALHIRVAVNAGKHSAMNGLFLLGRIHKQADCLAVNLGRQRGVGVASEAVAILELMLGV